MEIQKLKISEQDRKLVSDFMGEDYPTEIDFNSLMPVVEKIAKIISELKNDMPMQSIQMIEMQTLGIMSSKQDIYQKVIAFIQWYNTQSSQPGK